MEAPLYNLTTEILIKIFKYLSLEDLLNLRLTCHRFNTVITSGMHLFVKNDVLVTNQLMPVMKARWQRQLSMFEKIRISLNWKAGRYKERCMYKERRKCMPWLFLEKDRVWISREKHIKCYKRNNRLGPSVRSLAAKSDADICKFVHKENCVISGLGDGSLWVWTPKLKNNVLHYKDCHSSDINAVDLEGSILSTGSRDSVCKMWSLNYDDPASNLEYMYRFRMKDRVWCTGFSPGAQYLLIGTAGCNAPAACLIDVERKCQLNYVDYGLQLGSGILDIKWESPNILWTCGYDTCLRRWDLRMSECAQHWEDPYQSTVYCFDYDNYCSAITGVQNHGRTVLWDTRQQVYVQMYFMESCSRGRTSPVYSLGFDATHLYTATDFYLNVLDFTDSEAEEKDFSNYFSRVIIVD